VQKRDERGLMRIEAALGILVVVYPPPVGGRLYPKELPPPSLVSRGGGGAWGHSGGFTGLLRGWVWAGGGREGVGGCEIGPVVGHREQTL
jgi:hypothetical protein